MCSVVHRDALRPFGSRLVSLRVSEVSNTTFVVRNGVSVTGTVCPILSVEVGVCANGAIWSKPADHLVAVDVDADSVAATRPGLWCIRHAKKVASARPTRSHIRRVHQRGLRPVGSLESRRWAAGPSDQPAQLGVAMTTSMAFNLQRLYSLRGGKFTIAGGQREGRPTAVSSPCRSFAEGAVFGECEGIPRRGSQTLDGECSADPTAPGVGLDVVRL